ncbi:MAG: hypothetical protein MRY63_10320 [Neomegalonema sp.]|nr:hypothetical protein [Neomegalonema sp.]
MKTEASSGQASAVNGAAEPVKPVKSAGHGYPSPRGSGENLPSFGAAVDSFDFQVEADEPPVVTTAVPKSADANRKGKSEKSEAATETVSLSALAESEHRMRSEATEMPSKAIPIFLTILWIGAVFAFFAGYLRIPLGGPEMAKALLGMDGWTWSMIWAAAIGPTVFIWALRRSSAPGGIDSGSLARLERVAEKLAQAQLDGERLAGLGIPEQMPEADFSGIRGELDAVRMSLSALRDELDAVRVKSEGTQKLLGSDVSAMSGLASTLEENTKRASATAAAIATAADASNVNVIETAQDAAAKLQDLMSALDARAAEMAGASVNETEKLRKSISETMSSLEKSQTAITQAAARTVAVVKAAQSSVQQTVSETAAKARVLQSREAAHIASDALNTKAQVNGAASELSDKAAPTRAEEMPRAVHRSVKPVTNEASLANGVAEAGPAASAQSEVSTEQQEAPAPQGPRSEPTRNALSEQMERLRPARKDPLDLDAIAREKAAKAEAPAPAAALAQVADAAPQEPVAQEPVAQAPVAEPVAPQAVQPETPVVAPAAKAPPKAEPLPAPFAPPAGGLDWHKLIRAANFPDSEDDKETLAAIYAVLSDPDAAAMLQHAEDALSALADVDVFMDEFEPMHAPSSLWQTYIENNDAPNIMELGGILDPHALEDAEELLSEREGFEGIVDGFIASYERVLEKMFAAGQEPTLAVKLADTRTGRAYMLLARASKHFGA